ncbi:hypothetical protein BZG36_05531 [Bifiguratus adelaidae]|uniref:Major facilitator superfamily (MFS) profile domain-containing protein n=1 Tax=Bifiguratus adelaidae TaxID=1938954 RepID=A0A261XTD5_9FUNG|nr:hypothetical protein BZG36_05531 [Bifiguratus adelaidae]
MSEEMREPKVAKEASYHEFNFDGQLLKDVTPKLDKFWWHYPHLLKLNLLLLGAVLVQTTNGYDGSMLNGLQSISLWQNYFGNPTGAYLGTMTSGTTYGLIASLPFVTWFCERFGRRWPVIGGSVAIIFGAILQTAAQNYAMFVAGRFIIGFGLGVIQTCAPILLQETAYPSQRGKVTSFYEPTFPFGALLAAWITYGTNFITGSSWSWRIPSLLQCVPSLFQIVLCYYCPESPRWLVYNNREDEALEILIQYHGGGDRNSELVRFEMAEIKTTLEAEKVQKAAHWKEWLATKGNRYRLFIVLIIPYMLQLAGNALVSYYLHLVLNSIGITDSKTQLIINGCIQIWALITALIFAGSIDWLGRRFMFLGGQLGMMVSYIIWTALSAKAQQTNFANSGLSTGVLAMIFLYQLFYHMAAPAGPTYAMEITPFSLRSKASMLYQLQGQIAGIFNNYVNPIALVAIGWKYYIVYCVILAVWSAVVFFTFPETKGLGLEEVAARFDGADAVVGTAILKRGGRDVENSPTEPISLDHTIKA